MNFKRNNFDVHFYSGKIFEMEMLDDTYIRAVICLCGFLFGAETDYENPFPYTSDIEKVTCKKCLKEYRGKYHIGKVNYGRIID